MSASLGPRALALRDRPAIVAGTAAGAFLLAAAMASSDDGPVLCVWRRCSGGYCPGCGLTRSAGLLLRGHLAASWARHPFLPVLVLQALVLGLGVAVDPVRLRHRLSAHGPMLIAANGVLLIVIWLARLMTGSIPLPFG